VRSHILRMGTVIPLLAHAIVGWALCGATMALGLKFGTERTALSIHAVAAPVIFAALTWVYVTFFGPADPPLIAGVFLATVLVLDLVVVAGLIQRSLAMFRSVIGTWLPLASICAASWLMAVALAQG